MTSERYSAVLMHIYYDIWMRVLRHFVEAFDLPVAEDMIDPTDATDGIIWMEK